MRSREIMSTALITLRREHICLFADSVAAQDAILSPLELVCGSSSGKSHRSPARSLPRPKSAHEHSTEFLTMREYCNSSAAANAEDSVDQSGCPQARAMARYKYTRRR